MTTFTLKFHRDDYWDGSRAYLNEWLNNGYEGTLCNEILSKYFTVPKGVEIIYVHVSSTPVLDAYKAIEAGSYRLKIGRGKPIDMDIHIEETLKAHGFDDPTKPFWFWIEYDAPVAKSKAQKVGAA